MFPGFTSLCTILYSLRYFIPRTSKIRKRGLQGIHRNHMHKLKGNYFNFEALMEAIFLLAEAGSEVGILLANDKFNCA